MLFVLDYPAGVYVVRAMVSCSGLCCSLFLKGMHTHSKEAAISNWRFYLLERVYSKGKEFSLFGSIFFRVSPFSEGVWYAETRILFWKGIYFKRKEFAPCGSIYFSFESMSILNSFLLE